MKDVLQIYLILCVCGLVLGTEDEYYEESPAENNAISSDSISSKVPKSDCWMTLNAQQLFKVMDEIDDRYAKIREQVQDTLKSSYFDNTMIKGFLHNRGAAIRELARYSHHTWMIPSGINLGGYCMLRMSDSVLFFHRMKLRNNTHFRIDGLHNDLVDMVVRINLSLNDLHLKGAYERSLTDSDPSVLIYAPTFGQVEFLLKNVKLKMEGRYRLIKNRLLIELVSSEIIADDIMMTYINHAIESAPITIQKENLGAFLGRLKTDLDRWLKDYFNDCMIHVSMDGIPNIDELAKYDKEKETALEEYTDNAINAIGTRIRLLNADAIQLPVFTFKSVHGLQIKLYEGTLRGLDSMYRRSVATGFKQRNVRKVDTVVGFSNLKVVYKYEAMIPTGVPPLAGVLTLSANELTAHLALAMVTDPETVDLDIEFLDQMKPESLTVEGAANVMISNFKHLLEHQIVAIMSNALIHGIRMLRSLPTCEPFVPGQIKETKKVSSPQFSEYLTDTSNDNEENIVLLSTKEPMEALRTHSNKSVKTQNQTKVNKYKLRNKNKKKSYKRKQEITY